MSDRGGASITTHLGITFYPFDPRPEDIEIDDIAHALSHLCRYGGHTRLFYSVAQHSCDVAARVAAQKPEHALWGLLHDASEAYLLDIPAPIKKMPQMEFYREAEARVMACVCERFGLPLVQPDIVHEMDVAQFCAEAPVVLPSLAARIGIPRSGAMQPVYQTPDAAKTMFLDLFREHR